MSQRRDELMRLIEGLPDDQVEVLLEDRPAPDRCQAGRHLAAGVLRRCVSEDGRTDIARNIDEYIAEGFGASRS